MRKSFPPATQAMLLSILFSTIVTLKTNAQNYWEKIPAPTSQCYTDKDAFRDQVETLRNEVKQKIEASKRKTEEKVANMTQQEKMAIATRYQNMKPDEIVRMQAEMTEMMEASTRFQQIAGEFEERYNQLEAEYRTEFQLKLGPIEAEYRKLPDGEGTPDWAIKRGNELMVSYNKEYEALCSKYFTSSNALFKEWLYDFHTFLIEEEIPFTQKQIKMEYSQFGLEPDQSVATLMAVEKYLEKCSQVFGLRRSYPQG